jgi:hypothetical protein
MSPESVIMCSERVSPTCWVPRGCINPCAPPKVSSTS